MIVSPFSAVWSGKVQRDPAPLLSERVVREKSDTGRRSFLSRGYRSQNPRLCRDNPSEIAFRCASHSVQKGRSSDFLQTKTSGPRGPDDMCRSCQCGLVSERPLGTQLTARSVAGRTGWRIAVRVESRRRRGGAGWLPLAWRRGRWHRGRRRHRGELSGSDRVRRWPVRWRP